MALHNFTLTGQSSRGLDASLINVRGWHEDGIEFRVWLPADLEPKSHAEGDALFDRYLVAYDLKSGHRHSGKVHSWGQEYQAWYIDATLAPERR
jgi:hypothetical protein